MYFVQSRLFMIMLYFVMKSCGVFCTFSCAASYIYRLCVYVLRMSPYLEVTYSRQ
jgi:hypothetical protein